MGEAGKEILPTGQLPSLFSLITQPVVSTATGANTSAFGRKGIRDLEQAAYGLGSISKIQAEMNG